MSNRISNVTVEVLVQDTTPVPARISNVTVEALLSQDLTIPYTIQKSSVGSAANVASVAMTFSTLPTVGNLIVVHALIFGANVPRAATDVTDNQGNVYRLATYEKPTLSLSIAIYYTVVATSSGTFTITLNPLSEGNWTGRAIAEEWSPGISNFWNPSICLDKTVTNTGSGTTPSTGSTATLSDINELIINGVVINGDQTFINIDPTVSPGWISTYENLNIGAVYGGEFNNRVVSTTTAQSATWTNSPSGPWATVIATFRYDAFLILPDVRVTHTVIKLLFASINEARVTHTVIKALAETTPTVAGPGPRTYIFID